MINTSSDFTIHYGTEEPYGKSVERAKQHIDIPLAWMPGVKISHGAFRKITRNVVVSGTVETEHYGRKRVEYGKVAWSGCIVIVVQDGTIWRAIDRKAKANV
jgi:hypothetical protein